MAIACESIKKIRADMGGTNILSPLKWAIRQPIHRGHPRLLFLLTDGAVSNTGKVIELLRNHSASTRYEYLSDPLAHRQRTKSAVGPTERRRLLPQASWPSQTGTGKQEDIWWEQWEIFQSLEWSPGVQLFFWKFIQMI